MFLGILVVIYGMLMFFDYFFKSCMMLPYLDLLQTSGIDIRFFRIIFHTTRINRMIVKWSSKLPNFYKNSFIFGCYITIAIFPVAVFLVISSIFSPANSQSSVIKSSKAESAAHLEILLPGVNLPVEEIAYYVIALLICSVVHELGHGISAVLEDVPVLGFGLQLMIIIPIAYTQIDMENLQSMKLMKKLKIYSAGIWNNFILAGLSYILILILPILLSPIYYSDESVCITKIKENAPVSGENGLFVGDSIFQVNGHPTTNVEAWTQSLTDSLSHHPAYCVSEDFVHNNDESIHEIEHQIDGTVTCCPNNPSLNCFENFDEERLPQYICLNIRSTVEHSNDYCHISACPQHSSCIKPILSNSSTIIHMKRRNRIKDLVYYGHPYDVLWYVKVSRFTPKTKLIESWFGNAVELMLKYLVVFSSGLGLVNVVPCYGLDGQFLVVALISNLPSARFNKNQKELISHAIIFFGSISLFLATLKIFYTTFI